MKMPDTLTVRWLRCSCQRVYCVEVYKKPAVIVINQMEDFEEFKDAPTREGLDPVEDQ